MTMFCNLLWTTLIVGGAELVGRKLQIKCQIKLQIRLCHSQRWTQDQRERQRHKTELYIPKMFVAQSKLILLISTFQHPLAEMYISLVSLSFL